MTSLQTTLPLKKKKKKKREREREPQHTEIGTYTFYPHFWEETNTPKCDHLLSFSLRMDQRKGKTRL